MPAGERKGSLTYGLLAVILLSWIWLEIQGGSTRPDVLLQWGAQQNSLIWQGQIWRLFTPVFLHIGLPHLLLNSWALFILGRDVEIIFGHLRYLFIFLLSGVGGNLTYLLLSGSPVLSAGASGAIFGLFGALAYFGFLLPRERRAAFWPAIATPIMINIAYGLLNPQINNYAHLGGLVSGWIAALAVGLPQERAVSRKRLLGWGLLAVVLLLAAFQSGPARERDWGYLFDQGVRSFERGEYDQAELHFREVLQRNPSTAAAHYNLALVYVRMARWQDADRHAREALRLNPRLQDASRLLDEIRQHINSG